MRSIRELVDLSVQHGFWGTLRKGSENLVWLLYRIRHTDFDTKFRVMLDRRFDRRYGVDTSGLVGFQTLGVVGEAGAAGVHYEPTPASALRAILHGLAIEYSRYTFVDYGSGKGRALMLASEYPFRQVIGIEISDTLHAIAQANIQHWSLSHDGRAPILCLNIDATAFELPDTPLVLFFFTPFFSPVIDRVVEKIRARLERHTGDLRILYYGTNQHVLGLLQTLGLSITELYSKRPLAALKHYRAWMLHGPSEPARNMK